MSDNFLSSGETVSCAASPSGTSASFAGPGVAAIDCLVTNNNPFLIYVAFGMDATVNNGTPILPNSAYVLNKGTGVSKCSACSPSGSTAAATQFTGGQGG